MATPTFAPIGGGRVRLTLKKSDVRVLDDLFRQLAQLVASEQPAESDPLAAMVGIGTATSTPDDPALARLFPDAYPNDPDAASEFRRYTELGLRQQKYEAAVTARSTLPEAVRGRDLSAAETMAWLAAVNDLRLTLGTRLGADDHGLHPELLGDDQQGHVAAAVYEWLGWVQELLVECLDQQSEAPD